MVENQFIGTWQLVSWENRDSDGNVIYPYGQDAIGYIMYNADGYMSVNIMMANRSNFASEVILTGTTEEQAVASQSYLAYCGNYEIQSDKIIHYIATSLFPNWVGTVQERFFQFEGDRLVLSTPPLSVSGKQQTAHLTWERVNKLQDYGIQFV
ncbi:lipocalin-like domain-containing protein [Nostoc sp. CALU 546]|uniref:lipocalin-like domain-containing protein n=1 Tax=Nostoc sp. CALU 546 TaxID=1867241 RepID=UPI003B674C84